MQIYARATADEAGCGSRQGTASAGRLIDIIVDSATSASFAFALNRTRLRQIRRREGRYLAVLPQSDRRPRELSGNTTSSFVAVRRSLQNPQRGFLAIRPIFLSRGRVGSRPTFSSSPSWPIRCSYITLQRRLHALAPGLSARSAIEKFAAIQMIDVHVPTTDGRELVLTRYTRLQPESPTPDQPAQAPTTTSAAAAEEITTADQPRQPCRSEDFSTQAVDVQRAANKNGPQSGRSRLTCWNRRAGT